jgi:hypothetical protein
MCESESPDGYRPRLACADARLAAYVAAAGGVALAANRAEAAVVANTTVQSFGVNGEVNVDFNSDGQIDFQIDHDRVDLNGTNLDYLQLDKNDVNGAANPLAFDPQPNINLQASTFPPGATTPNNQTDAGYATLIQGAYPSALQAGDLIGPDTTFDYQEGDNFNDTSKWIRANRLIDEDATQIDRVLGGRTEDGVYVPTDGPNFVGLDGAVRYLGVRLHLNGAPKAEPRFGWIGLRIDNEADATGAVVGYAYETEVGTGILAGDIGAVVANADYDGDGDVDGADFLVWQRENGTAVIPKTSADGTGDGQINGDDLAFWKTAVAATPATAAAAAPEPGTLILAGLGGMLLVGRFALGRLSRKAAGRS